MVTKRKAADHLPHCSGTNQYPAPKGYRWRVNDCATVTTRPGCVPAAGATLVTDEHLAWAEWVPARAALRRQDHPATLGAGHEVPEAGHRQDGAL